MIDLKSNMSDSVNETISIGGKSDDDFTNNIFIDTEPQNISEPQNTLKKTKRKSRKIKMEKKRIKSNEFSAKERALTDALFGDTPLFMDVESGIQTLGNVSSSSEEPSSSETLVISNKKEIVDDQIKTKRKAAWIDEDEESVKLKDVAASYSKAKGSRGIRETSEALYKESLTEMFADVYGDTPDWAKKGRKLTEDEEEDSMARSTSVYLAADKSLVNLPKTTLDYKVISNLNEGSYKEGSLVKAIDFCPEMGIALVGGSTSNKFGSVSLFQFSGKKNHKIKTIMFPDFPIRSAKFLPGKQQFVVSSRQHGRLFVYDIQEANKIDVPSRNIGNPKSIRFIDVSPDGKYLLSVSTGGWIHFLDSSSLSVVESTRIPAEISDLVFDPSSCRIFIHGDSGKVYIFDLTTWRCSWAFYDDGCVEGTSIAVSPDSRLLACGSSSGIVNIYDLPSVLTSSSPSPLKVIKSLVTPITSLAFNPTSEILAIASDLKENALKLVHTKSLTVFANFPGPFNLNRIQTVKFSPDCKFLTAGNNKKSAFMCRLLHY